jgi:hypothetical protein
MKIKPEHYATLRDRMAAIPRDTIAAHHDALGDKATPKRMRWDILWATKSSRWICDNIYPYANDVHLDTALRSIMRELNMKEFA